MYIKRIDVIENLQVFFFDPLVKSESFSRNYGCDFMNHEPVYLGASRKVGMPLRLKLQSLSSAELQTGAELSGVTKPYSL